jgi:hypothetical protein
MLLAGDFNDGWNVTDVVIADQILEKFYFLVYLSNGFETISINLDRIECWPYANSINLDNCPGDSLVNPYVVALRGQYKPQTQFVYKTARKYTYKSGSPDLRESGLYAKLEPFWSYDIATNSWLNDSYNWQYTSTISNYSPFGNEVENQDALGRYSAALFGYSNTLPKAVAQNARYNEIYSENFEDYKYPIDEGCYYIPHFMFEKNADTEIAIDTSHTGKYSMRINANSSVNASNDYFQIRGSQSSNTANYILSDIDYLGGFSPSPLSGTKSFILNLWVKQENTVDLKVKYQINSGSIIEPSLINQSIIIDGWKQLTYQFDLSYISSSAGNFKLYIENNSTTDNLYVDDIRIQPFNSSLKAFVYHPISHKYSAELDENNYATFYEYDNAGNLLRIKKETERGIMTIQESFNHIQTTEPCSGCPLPE